jgi:hypothetical protein
MPFTADLRVGYFKMNFNMSWYWEFLSEREIEFEFDDGYEDDNGEISKLELHIERAVEKYVISKIFCKDGEENKQIDNMYDNIWDYLYEETLEHIKNRNTEKYPNRIKIKSTKEDEE